MLNNFPTHEYLKDYKILKIPGTIRSSYHQKPDAAALEDYRDFLRIAKLQKNGLF